MSVEDPGTFTVTCDNCSKTQEMECSEYAGTPRSWGVEDETIERYGWAVNGDYTFCPECSPDGGGEDD